MSALHEAARAAQDALDAACGAFSAAEPYLPSNCQAEFTFYASWEDVKGALDKLKDAMAAAPAQAPQPLGDDDIDIITSEARDALMDHVYEHGTTCEGQQRFIRQMARAVERAIRGEKKP